MDNQLLTDIMQWDIRNWSEALEFWERRVDWSNVHTCLELGARDGGLSLWLGLKNKTVVCSDVEHNRHWAREHHKKYDIDSHVEYAVVDATNIPYEDYFDIITFKSVLVNIGWGDDRARQQATIDQIYKALKPGGKMLFAENLVGSSLHSFVRKRCVHWGASCRYVTTDEMRSFTSRFSRLDMRTTGVLGVFGRTEFQRNLLSSFDQALLNRLTPPRWRYLVYGIAEK
jgi:ubiquinone/menaquinone biosynthesis C-methylase UbiE